MSDLNSLADALREGRAALLNPNLSEHERNAAVKVLEGALDFVKSCGPDAEILRPATADDLAAFGRSQEAS